MARKSRRKAKKKEELKLSVSDYQFPGQKGAYLTAMGSTVGLFIIVGVILMVTAVGLVAGGVYRVLVVSVQYNRC